MSAPRAENGTSPSGASVLRLHRRGYKRPFDLAMVAVLGVMFAPLWVLLGLLIPAAVWLEDRGRIFHVQRRVGLGGKPFNIIKFRTMVEDAERLTGPVLAVAGDSRSTKVGRVLRRLHLDEIPQIINVVKGDMSLVGPRPERPELAEIIEREVPEFRERLHVRPGIAGLAQAHGTYYTSPRAKLRYDRLYMSGMGPFLDLKILVLCLLKAASAVYRNE